MKNEIRLIAAALLLGSNTASAWWGDNGWDWNPWPVWTPMYWMEEMVGDNDWHGGPYGYGPYGYAPYGGYGYAPYGNPYYSPYGGGYGYAPYGNPYYGGGWR